ncbi:ABC transporter permease [Limnochorda pilosa]|uniref:ABC transporter permease n=1 Tax=Limnochorda pilosa TaxID=1555112 RepID=A0A0K2SN89_LIMPI|nr:FtsX-like permease family protein [Limnochorda pilosa]BAS28576.1 hypothetical protein LIP_2746 [Limnochorda pilosa]
MAIERQAHPHTSVPSTSGFARITGLFLLARRQLRNRWLESVLVLLGLALGVAVLSTALSFLAFSGAAQRSTEAMPEYRAFTIMPQQADVSQLFRPDAPAVLPLRRLEGEPPRLTLELALRMRDQVEGVESVLLGGGRSRSSAPLQAVDGEPLPVSEGEQPSLHLVPVGADFFGSDSYQVVAGQPFAWEDVRAGRTILAVEEAWAERFLPDVPLDQVPGHQVTAFGRTWSIVAVVRRPDGPSPVASPFGPREMAYGPWGAPDFAEDAVLEDLQVVPRLDADRGAVRRALELILSEAFGPEQMTITSPQDLVPEQQRRALLAVGGLASLALLVASLNVLNLFLTRVVRRRRHLALSTALGASRRVVFGQTLLESLVLGLGGGVAGLLIALGGVRVVEGLVLRGVPSGLFEEGIRLGLGPVLWGLAAALGASLLFGLYPALAAASQDPAEALRE